MNTGTTKAPLFTASINAGLSDMRISRRIQYKITGLFNKTDL